MPGDLAFFLQLFDVLVEAEFRDGADGGGRNFQRDPFLRLWDEEPFGVQVGHEAALRFGVGVRDRIARDWPFARQFTDF